MWSEEEVIENLFDQEVAGEEVMDFLNHLCSGETMVSSPPPSGMEPAPVGYR